MGGHGHAHSHPYKKKNLLRFPSQQEKKNKKKAIIYIKGVFGFMEVREKWKREKWDWEIEIGVKSFPVFGCNVKA